VQIATIVLFALVMGVFWGTWFSLSRTMDRLSAATFLTVGREMIHNLATPMTILLPLALVCALVAVGLLRSRSPRPAPEFWWMLAGFVLMLGALVVTLAVEVPIDNHIKTWTVATLPADWRSVQSRWELYHTIRTFLSIGALVAVTVSAVGWRAVGRERPARDRLVRAGR
jgi:uncharacterized membrane protein